MGTFLFAGSIPSWQLRGWSRRLGWRVVALLMLWSGRGERCAGLELALPAVGTNIRYDFHAQTPDFEIAHAAAPHQILDAQLTFTDHKYLRIAAGPESFFEVDLTLRAEGILELFETSPIQFDESMSLLREDGSALATREKNSAFGYNHDFGNYVFFRWDFHALGESIIHGLRWSISPDLIAGAELPPVVGLEIRMWSTEPIFVAPETSSTALIVAALLCCPTRGPRRPRAVAPISDH